MTLRIGVLPAPSRNTPTPTSILSGRGSALTIPISAMSESFMTGGRSASPLAFASVRVSMELRLAKSRVVIHCDAVAERHRLAGENVAVRHFLVGQAIARRHFHLALGDLRPACRADSRLAGEGRRKACAARTVE